MAFIDNSGDIILDAVLTDTGRKRLARGDGSFQIVKFALGDDEIDYSLYRNSNSAEGVHPSGSAYYDLNILQTPILEAFTNNMSVLKSKLISYTQNDLLYLPVVRLNSLMYNTAGSNANWNGASELSCPTDGYLMTADKTTSDLFGTGEGQAGTYNNNSAPGYIQGDNISTQNAFLSNPIVFDEGLETTELNVDFLADGDARKETSFIVECDNRLFTLYPPRGDNPRGSQAKPSYVDDDNVASYFFARNTSGPNANYFAPRASEGDSMPGFIIENGVGSTANAQSILGTTSGRYGVRFGFRIAATLNLQTSNYLFTTLGGEELSKQYNGDTSLNANFLFIDTTLRITGYTTGCRVDVPIRIVKKKA